MPLDDIAADLPTDVDATYADQSPGDAEHQQHHDLIHEAVQILADDYSDTAEVLVLIGAALGGVRPEDFGAVGDGVTDDTAAVLAAVAECWVRGGSLLLLTGWYAIADVVQCIHAASGVMARLWGIGSESCGFICTTAEAQVRIGSLPEDSFAGFGARDRWGGFKVDGGTVAEYPLFIGWGGDFHGVDIVAEYGAIDSFSVIGLQNSKFTACRSEHRVYSALSGAALVVDAGSANLWFDGCKFTKGSSCDIHLRQTIEGFRPGRRRPSKIRFTGLLCESHVDAEWKLANVIFDDSEQCSIRDGALNGVSDALFPNVLIRSGNGGPDDPDESDPEDAWYTEGTSTAHYIDNTQFHAGSAAIEIADVGTRPKSIEMGPGNLIRVNCPVAYKVEAANGTILESGFVGIAGIEALTTTYFESVAGLDVWDHVRSTTADFLAPRVTRLEVSGTTHTLVLTDAGLDLETTNGSAVTVTVPADVFDDGHIVNVRQYGAGQVTISAGVGVTLRTPNGAKTAKQYATASIVFRSPTEAVVAGDVAP